MNSPLQQGSELALDGQKEVFQLAGTVDELPGACREQSTYTRADESEDGRQNGLAFVAGTDDHGGGTVVDGNAEAEAGACSNRGADERVTATMAIPLDGNALNALAREGLVSVRGMKDKNVVAHGLQVALIGLAGGQRYFGLFAWGELFQVGPVKIVGGPKGRGDHCGKGEEE